MSGAVAQNKVYDGTTLAAITGATLVGVVGSDIVTLVVSPTFIDKNVGNNKAVIPNMILRGIHAANYQFIQPYGITADVIPKTLTMSGVSAQKT